VQAPENSQSYNKYSYAFNNPLKYTDPTGYTMEEWLNTAHNPYRNVIVSNSAHSINARSGFKYGTINYRNGNYVNTWTGENVSFNDVNNNIILPNASSYKVVASTKEELVCTSASYDPSEGTFGVDQLTLHNIKWTMKTYTTYGLERINGQTGETGGGELGAANLFGAVGVAGSGIGTLDGSFRISNGSKGMFSPKYYSSGWKGGSRARISTYSAAKVGIGISTGANVITTGMAYYDIATGNHQPITYVDAGVGTMGIIASGASYFAGVQIPYVGAAVAVYGAVRVTWDVSFYLGTQYGPSTWYGNNDYRWFK